MDRITIEKAADVYADKAPESYCNGHYGKYAIADAFEEGAKWRINSVWHEANKEIPIAFRPILVEHDDGKFSVNMVAGNMQSCPMAWSRWAYIDDLLPDGKEADNG